MWPLVTYLGWHAILLDGHLRDLPFGLADNLCYIVYYSTLSKNIRDNLVSQELMETDHMRILHTIYVCIVTNISILIFDLYN